VGLFVVRWEVGILAKYLYLSVISMFVSLCVYEVLIGRIRVTRAVFGIRRRRLAAR
jgi:hypothetical protein